VTVASNPQAEAFETMRRGVLFLLIAWLLIGIGLSLALFGVITGALSAPSHPGLGLGGAMGALVAMIVVVIVGAIIALVGLWGHFVPGVEKLAEINPEFSTAATLIRVGLYYGLILPLSGAI
jgi:fatty acid desaturase